MSQSSPWETVDLEALERQAWRSLVRGVHDPKHAFHWPTVATTSPLGMPEVRTVVLREANRAARTLTLHTDWRSAKIQAITSNPHLAWHLYDRKRRVQLRLNSIARIHHGDDIAQKIWETIPARGRYTYCHQPAPGTPQAQWHPGPPREWLDHSPTLAETEPFYQNFVVICAEVQHLEVLHLAQRGHYRAHFTYQDAEVIRSWCVP